jgi:hypothetical protein
MTRKIEAVLHGLSEIHLDRTTEEQMTKMVPYLTERDWEGSGFWYRSYYVHISNESDALHWPYALTHTYRYISFDAGVLVQDAIECRKSSTAWRISGCALKLQDMSAT